MEMIEVKTSNLYLWYSFCCCFERIQCSTGLYLWRDKNNFLVQFLAKAEFVLICLKKTNKHKLSNGFWLGFLLEIQSSYA